jgi:signal transduction histidine kinase
MIKKLQQRFMLIITIIAGILLAIMFFCIPLIEEDILTKNALSTLDVIMDSPDDVLSSKDTSTSYRYTFFQTDPIGNITKFYSREYNRNDLQRIYRSIQRDWNGPLTMRIDDWQLYYVAEQWSGGSRYAIVDASYDISHINSLKRTCRVLYALSMLIVIAFSFLMSIWISGPVEQAWNQQRRFIADASHELKTPLTVILTNAELLNRSDASVEEKNRYQSNILVESRQMKTLIESLLDFARIDRGISSVNFTEVNLSKLAEDESLVMEVELFEKGHELSSDIVPGLTVKGDGARLRQVIDILLDNAGKYADEGSRITMSLKKSGSSRVLLTVANPSPDIPGEELSKIFRRFYRIDQSRPHNGSYGLGLSIASEIIKSHHGIIWAESENHITTFKIILPLK